jgi:hypothetical protein
VPQWAKSWKKSPNVKKRWTHYTSQTKKVMATGNQISMKKGHQIFKDGQAANGLY